MTFWYWLGNNSLQIQALAGVAAVIVAILIGWVAWKQKKAAQAQADAASQQTKAAQAQAEAANQQVIAAKQQTETSLLIADKQTSPHISITAAAPGGAIIPRAFVILNNGVGMALNLELKYKDGLPGDDISISTKTLVMRDSFSVSIDPARAALGLKLKYQTVFGTKYLLEFQWNGIVSRAVNEKLSLSKESAADSSGGH